MLCFAAVSSAAEWSFGGGYMYFDNSQTKWADNSIMLVIGKSTWSGIYEMTPSDEPDLWFCALPSSGWGDAEYMAVIGGGSVWHKGGWGADNLVTATHYTAAYTAGLKASAGQGYLFTPQSTNNGCIINLTYRGEGYKGRSFESAEKSNCHKIDGDQITFIFSTSDKRFNISRSDIKKVYVYGSVSAWGDKEDFRLRGYSDDGCFYRTFPLSVLENVGNSGQPEFLFHIYKTDGTEYIDRAHSSWANVDTRLLFANSGGVNMVVALPGDDLDEIHSRSVQAEQVDVLSNFDLTNPSEQARIANWRLVPATKNLYRSYHPFDPSRAKFDTEERRLYWVAQLATAAGINCDIALSGNETGKAGQTYSCGGHNYTITIPEYYKTIINNNRVLYVGTANGHTPSYEAIFESGGERFGQWIKEVVEFVLDDAHPAPYQIHCALGSDRTGAFCATIAALCGATWEQIATDYEATSNMKVNEYRHRNCIRYCLKHLCGVDPATDATFNEAVKKHFIDDGYLTEAQITALKAKLNGQTTAINGLKDEGMNGLTGESGKMLHEGRIVILNGDKNYSAVGQRLK